MERKYFFFDIDGTLASGSADLPVAERVPASALKALAELRARGHFLALATGRLQVMAVDYLEQLGFDHMVADGGYSLTVDHKLVDFQPIDRAAALDLIAECDARGLPWSISPANDPFRYARDGRFAVIPCRLVRQKGLDQVLHAITRLGPECSDIQFMFCGVGPERDLLLSIAGQLGIASRTHFPGTIDRLDVLLPAFDMAILPSLYEGLSYVLLESLAAGIPLIVSDILANVPRPELRDILNTFTVGDCDELAAQIALVAGDPQRTQARASLGAAYMRQNFRLSSQIQKLSNLYRFLQ